jgi:hypothetical protein
VHQVFKKNQLLIEIFKILKRPFLNQQVDVWQTSVGLNQKVLLQSYLYLVDYLVVN